jgi:hypothetical protein
MRPVSCLHDRLVELEAPRAQAEFNAEPERDRSRHLQQHRGRRDDGGYRRSANHRQDAAAGEPLGWRGWLRGQRRFCQPQIGYGQRKHSRQGIQ